MELLSTIINLIVASGLIGTLIFYNSKRRKVSAEAAQSEYSAESAAISNMRQSLVEWKEIAQAREDKLNIKDTLIDRLYAEKSEERQKFYSATMEISELKLRNQALEFRTCNKRGCEDREPQSGY